MLLHDFVVGMLQWVDENVVLAFGIVFVWLLREGTMAGTGFLAQASMFRLGKTNRGSPKLFCANGRLGDSSAFLSEEWSRLGEKGLAWARIHKNQCSTTRALA